MPAAMLCKKTINSGGETYCGIGESKTKHACIVEVDESTRIQLEGTLHEDHEDHVAAKGIHSISHFYLVRKFIPMPQALEILDAKAAVEKEEIFWKRYQHGS